MSQQIICPHCQHKLDTNEGREAMTCPACDQEFWVQGGYIPHYTTAFAEELLDEELLD